MYRHISIFLLLTGLWAPALAAPPLLDEADVAALASELSGETAKRNLEFLARHHRMRGSREFRAVAEHIAEQCRLYGLDEVEIVELPVDGKIFYGTQRSRPAWDAEFAELWETDRDGNRRERIASFDAMPVTLAQDSESGHAFGWLVDVGTGASRDDYRDRDVEDSFVLTSSQPQAVAGLALDTFGAAGIISYAPNQRSAWWKENESLVRWGHLGAFRKGNDFAFMVSLKRARSFQERLAGGEAIWLEAEVRAGRHAGAYSVVSAAIRGSDPELAAEEIVYSCHLDHQKPGANDNASGSVAILEVARTLSKLIAEGRLERPRRTVRFIWPPEIEGTMALLVSRPEWAERIKAAIHLDMVGGGPQTKAVFHVTRGPASLPSFINDVAEAFGRFVNEQSDALAAGNDPPYPLVSLEGGKESLLAQMVPFTMGSDHQVYSEGSWRIPSIYLNDWPDRYIHTNHDTPAMVDPTKLLRSAFIGAASGLYLAQLGEDHLPPLWTLLEANSLRRTASRLEEIATADGDHGALLRRHHLTWERALFASVDRFTDGSAQGARTQAHLSRIAEVLGGPVADAVDSGPVYRRNPDLPGPMSVFGYNYLTAHLAGRPSPRLLGYRGERGAGGEVAFEVLNLVDGQRSVKAIRDYVAAVYGPVPTELIEDFLALLAELDVVQLM